MSAQTRAKTEQGRRKFLWALLLLLFSFVAIISSFVMVSEYDPNGYYPAAPSIEAVSTTTTKLEPRENQTSSVPKEGSNEMTKHLKVKFVGFSDSGYVPVAMTWYNQLLGLGYQNHVVIATDLAAYQTLSTAHSNDGSPLRVEYFKVQLVKSGNQAIRFNDLWRRRMQYVLEQTQSGVSVFLSDVDNLFSRYIPLEGEHFQSSEFDLMHAHGTNHPPEVKKKQGFVVTAGFSFFKGNAKVANMLEWVVQRCSPECDDQREVNKFYLERMKWSNVTGPTDALTSRYGEGARTGIDEESGLRVLALPRTFAYRGMGIRKPENCPKNLWAAMPTSYKSAAAKQEASDVWQCTCGRMVQSNSRAAMSLTGAPLNCTDILQGSKYTLFIPK